MEKDAHFHKPRRADRAVEDQAWLAAMLHSAPYAALGTVWEAQPFVKPTLFAYDEAGQVIYFHTAQEGRTRANLEANPQACLCISEMGRLLPAKTAMGFSIEYSSVMVFGTVHIVVDPAESRYGLQMLLDKYFPHLNPGEDYRPILPDELARTTVYRLEIEHMSGKNNRGSADHPDAFFYGEQPA